MYYLVHINDLLSMQKMFVMSPIENNIKQFINRTEKITFSAH